MSASPTAAPPRTAGEAAEALVSAEELDACVLIDTSESRPVYLLTRGNGAYVRLSPSAYELLRLRASGAGSDEVARRASVAGRTVTAAEVDEAVAKVEDEIRRIERDFKPGFFGLWVKGRLLPAAVVGRIARVLEPAFRAPLPLVFLALIAAAYWKILSYEYPLDPTTGAFWIGYALFLATIFAHELGHAAACSRYGARPGEIGVALYLIYFAFYANVSTAWTLKRWQRVVVDAGGVYFQLIVGAAYTFAYEATGWVPLKLAALAVGANILFTLNPIFRFDGYWLLSDSLGVTNLSRQPARILARVKQRLRGERPAPLPWSGGVTAVMSFYAFVSIAGWAVFMVLIIPWLWTRHLAPFPETLAAFARDLWHAPEEVGAHRVRAMLRSSFFAVLGTLLVYRMMAKPATAWALRRARSALGLPPAPPPAPARSG